jgi:hypothetical protein
VRAAEEGSPQLPAQAGAAGHLPDRHGYRIVLKIADRERRQPFGASLERKQEAAAHDGQVSVRNVVALQVGNGGEV